MTDDLIETHDGGIATLTMNRPAARNAMSGAMLQAMQISVMASIRRWSVKVRGIEAILFRAAARLRDGGRQ